MFKKFICANCGNEYEGANPDKYRACNIKCSQAIIQMFMRKNVMNEHFEEGSQEYNRLERFKSKW